MTNRALQNWPTDNVIEITAPQPIVSLLDAAILDLGQCDWSDDYTCHEPATVFHLGTESEFCLRHFNQFEKECGRFYRPDHWGTPCN